MSKDKTSKKQSTVSKKKVAKKKVTTRKTTTKKVAKKKAVKKTAPGKKANPVMSTLDQSKQANASQTERDEMIAVAAYYRWEQSGYSAELEIEHWLLAEQDIDDQMK